MVAQVINPTGVHENVCSTPGLAQWVKVQCCHDAAWILNVCGVGQWLQLRFDPCLAWELPYAMGAALKKRKKRKMNALVPLNSI